MPRPTKLNAETQQRIVNALEAGNYFDAACEYAGITATTGYNWKARGKKESERRENPNVKEGSQQWLEEQPYLEFFEAVTRASANVEIRTMALIHRAGTGDEAKGIQGDWRALTWFMEHRYPEKWGRTRVESTGANGGAIETEATIIIKSGMSLDEL